MFGLLYEENPEFSHPLVVTTELKQEKKNGVDISELQMKKTYLKFKMFAKKKGGEGKWIGLRKKKKKQLVFEEKEACVVQTHRLDTNMVECMHIRNKLKA